MRRSARLMLTEVLVLPVFTGLGGKNLLPLKYVAKEFGIPMPQPIVPNLDATTAVAFMDGTVRRSKMHPSWPTLIRRKCG